MCKDPEEPFSQECLLNKILRVNRKQMCVVWALLLSLTSTTCECTLIWGCFWNANRKWKWNSALDSLSTKLFYKGLQCSHHRTKLNHFRSRWCNVVLAFVRCTPHPGYTQHPSGKLVNIFSVLFCLTVDMSVVAKPNIITWRNRSWQQKTWEREVFWSVMSSEGHYIQARIGQCSPLSGKTVRVTSPAVWMVQVPSKQIKPCIEQK